MHNRLSRWSVVVAAGLAVTPRAAAADSVTLLSQSNIVFAGVRIQDASGATTHTQERRGEGSMSVTADLAQGSTSTSATGSLVIDLSDPHHLFGFGAASGIVSTADSADATGDIQFVLRFRVDDPHLYDFSGSFTGNGAASDEGVFRSSSWEAILFNNMGQRLFRFRGNGPDLHTSSGLLGAGEYGFVMAATGLVSAPPGMSSSTEGFDFTFDLSDEVAPVPEPGSMLLIGTGLIGLAGAVRRRAGGRTAVKPGGA